MKDAKHNIIITGVSAVLAALLYLHLSNKIGNKKPLSICVLRPKNVSEALEVYTAIQNGKTCLVDLTDAEATEAQRIADYLFGMAYATNRKVKRVSGKVLILLRKDQDLESLD